jgi:hypothetical protein
MAVVVTGGTEGVDYTSSIIGNIETITFLTAATNYTVQFPKTSTVEYTVVGGGGGGGYGNSNFTTFRENYSGGGGGGGRVLNGVLSAVKSTAYGVYVGNGGNGKTTSTSSTNGTASVFSTINSSGGSLGSNGAGTTDNGTGGNSGSGAAGGIGADLTTGVAIGGNGSSPGGGGGGGAFPRGGAGANGVLVQSTYYGGGGGGGCADGSAGSAGLGGGGSGASGALNYAVSGVTNTGGGGGGSVGMLNAGNGGSGIVILAYTFPEPFPCFKQDSKILTDSGYKMVQNLRKGDMVRTINHGFVPIFAIGKRDICHPACSERVSHQLYRCSNDKYPEVFEDLVITGCHSILVDNFKEGEKDKTCELLKNIFITDNKYRLPACIDERTRVYDISGSYTIYHFALENSDYYMNYGVYANGLLVETCSKRYITELANMELIE